VVDDNGKVRNRDINFSVNSKLAGYDRETDKLIFKSRERLGESYAPTVDSGDIIIVDRASMPQYYDELYIDVDGTPTKIGDIAKSGKTGTTETFDPTKF
jgi:hypothetical protein